MSKKTITPVATIVGAALAGSLSVAHAAATDGQTDDLFTAIQIDGGSLLIAGEGTCGEGKCGDKMDGGDDGGKEEG
jgi:uncharacterized low-complexity protein